MRASPKSHTYRETTTIILGTEVYAIVQKLKHAEIMLVYILLLMLLTARHTRHPVSLVAQCDDFQCFDCPLIKCSSPVRFLKSSLKPTEYFSEGGSRPHDLIS